MPNAFIAAVIGSEKNTGPVSPAPHTAFAKLRLRGVGLAIQYSIGRADRLIER